jgi:glycosyltransferase involved in cell wall biosynthesis
MPAKRPDVVIFGNLRIGGGRGRCLANMIPIWERAGVRVAFVGYRDARCIEPEAFANALAFHHLGTRSRLWTLIRLWLYLVRHRPRAILARNHLDNVLVTRATRLPGVRTRAIVEARNNYVAARHRQERKRRAKLDEVRRVYPRASALITASSGVADDLVEAAGLDGLPVRAIPNTIITPSMFEQAREPVDHPWLAERDQPIVLAVARLADQKDLPTLLRALRIARETRPMRLIILGKGPRKEAVEREIADLGLRDCVHLAGHVPNPYAWMRQADLLALSSAWEGSPNVLIEALALGTPVVSTDCPSGPREILEGGRHGRLVPVGDAAALARAMLETLDDPIRPDPAEATARFTADNAARQYLEVLLPDGPGHPPAEAGRPARMAGEPSS